MKKCPSSSATDWYSCEKNFPKRTTSPRRKARKRAAFIERSVQTPGSNFKSECITSQDESIHWSSSDEEIFKHADKQQSPVMCGSSSKRFIALGGSYIKSTPSGSPILSQRYPTTAGKRPKPRRFSLLPISPISTDLPSDVSLPNVSSFSLHAHEESEVKEITLDTTPLAVPLSESENEDLVESFEQTPLSYDGQTQDVIEVLTTQDVLDDDCEAISTLEDTLEASSNQSPNSTCKEQETATSDVKGSVWIESLMEKLDNDSKAASPKKLGLSTSTQYDSAKKQKFIKNGMAEHLNRVIRQQQTQKVLFRHQMRGISNSDVAVHHRSMKLKVISHHRDGLLHVMECKMISKGKKCEQKKKFLTLILNHEEVVENEIDLMTVLTIFPPWKEIHLQQHNFPVLICVYHIKVNSFGTKSVSASQAEPSNDTPAGTKEKTVDEVERRQDCENLLEALERQESENGICVAATVQRMYQTTAFERTSWNWLCEDAYGVFFELTLEDTLSADESWSQFIKHGEGHRLYFERLFLRGRTTRKQVPGLFSLIDSAWNSDGFGLLQVQNSQSQELEENTFLEDSPVFQAPNFCYKLNATRWQSKCYFSTEGQEILTASKLANNGLNRPNANGSASTDVLYKAPIRLKCAGVLSQAKMYPNVSRFSVLGKVFHQHLPNQSTVPVPMAQTINDAEYHHLYIIDETTSNAMDIAVIIVRKDEDISVTLNIGDFVLFKNVRLKSDGDFIVDTYSQVVVLEVADDKMNRQSLFSSSSLDSVLLELQRFSDVGVLLLDRYRQPNIAELKTLRLEDAPGTFATVEGVICSLASAENHHVLPSQHGPLSRDENFLRVLKSQEDPSTSSALADSVEILVIVELAFKVRLKILQRTAWKLVSEVGTHEKVNSSFLNGRKTGRHPCFVYAKLSTPVQAVFFAEEINTT